VSGCHRRAPGRTALTVIGLTVIAVAAGASQRASETQTEVKKPPTPIHPVVLTLSGDPCDHDVSVPNVKLDANHGEAVGWWIRNDCHNDEEVLFCVYEDQAAAPLYNKAFKACKSHTPHGGGIGKVFKVGSTETGLLECDGDLKGEYLKLVLTGTDIPTNKKCPSTLPSPYPPPAVSRTHRLGVEIIR
jgi:hypothetical protein